MSCFYDTSWAAAEFKRCRDKYAGRPIKHNTRLLFDEPSGNYIIRFHSTPIITINQDNTWTLRAHGWQSVTTMQRLREFSPVKLFSDHGQWYVWLEPNPSDPMPPTVNRSIPKPYTAEDPGPEPVKSTEGCIAGTVESHEKLSRTLRFHFDRDRNRPRGMISHESYSTDPLAALFSASAQFDRMMDNAIVPMKIVWGEESYRYYGRIGHNETYRQCPHCKEFNQIHEAWRLKMHGSRWGRRFDELGGYATYRKMMDRYGSQEAWHDAYIADFRARKAYLKAAREWEARNRIAFYDGITVDSDGYAQRERTDGPSTAKLSRHEKAVERMNIRIGKYVKGYITKLSSGMPMPGGADCWYCLFTKNGQAMGDLGGGSDHLISHMKEHYYVPSLAINAMREAGYRDTGIAIWLNMDPDTDQMGGKNDEYASVKRSLVKYMQKRLVPNAPTK